MEVKKKSKIFLNGLDQGIRLTKEQHISKLRKVFCGLVISLDESELEILASVLNQHYNTQFRSDIHNSKKED